MGVAQHDQDKLTDECKKRVNFSSCEIWRKFFQQQRNTILKIATNTIIIVNNYNVIIIIIIIIIYLCKFWSWNETLSQTRDQVIFRNRIGFIRRLKEEGRRREGGRSKERENEKDKCKTVLTGLKLIGK